MPLSCAVHHCTWTLKIAVSPNCAVCRASSLCLPRVFSLPACDMEDDDSWGVWTASFLNIPVVLVRDGEEAAEEMPVTTREVFVTPATPEVPLSTATPEVSSATAAPEVSSTTAAWESGRRGAGNSSATSCGRRPRQCGSDQSWSRSRNSSDLWGRLCSCDCSRDGGARCSYPEPCGTMGTTPTPAADCLGVLVIGIAGSRNPRYWTSCEMPALH